ncbi:MAG TPA: FecR family protein [Terracidiphilus sp.]|nr:FecR family protein [Terracidiphilus sp.]
MKQSLLVALLLGLAVVAVSSPAALAQGGGTPTGGMQCFINGKWVFVASGGCPGGGNNRPSVNQPAYDPNAAAAAAAAAEAERQRQADLKHKQEVEAQRLRDAEAEKQRKLDFERKKQETLQGMKGVSESELGLKGSDAGDLGLKGLGDTDSIGLKNISTSSPPPQAHVRIGAAAAIRGEVYWLTSDGRKVPITSGGPVYSGARIVTGDNARMQVLLLDETVFTIGANSDMVLDEFVYDPSTSAGKVTARLTKGIFRFVTGKVARKNPEDLKVKLPVGTIGIRGTDVEIDYQPGAASSIRLFLGELEITESKTGKKFTMHGGQMMAIASNGSFSAPIALNPHALPKLALEDSEIGYFHADARGLRCITTEVYSESASLAR